MNKERALRTLFKNRANQFDAYTAQIFSLLSTAIEGVTEYLVECKEHFKGSSNLEWKRIVLLHEKEMVFFTGFQTQPEGSKVETTEGEVVITKDNAQYFERTFEVIIPLSVALTDNKLQVVEYLRKTNEANTAELTDKMQKFIQLLNPKKEEVVDEQEEQDFDLSALTEDQRKSLITASSKGKKPN